MTEEEARKLHPMAKAVRQRRLELNLSREDVAARTHGAISASMVSYYERSTNPLAPLIIQIYAKALDWPMRELEQYAHIPPVGPQKERYRPYVAPAFRLRESVESFTALMAEQPYLRNLMRTPEDDRYVVPEVQLAWEFWEHSRAKYEYASEKRKA